MLPKHPDKVKVTFSIASVLLAAICAFWLPKDIFIDTALPSLLATIFSINAGVLIAIFSVLTTLGHTGSWQYLENNRRRVLTNLTIFKVLFVCYFLVLGILLTMEALSKTNSTTLEYLAPLCVFLSVFAFIQSLSLPHRISKMYMEHYDRSIETSRNRD